MVHGRTIVAGDCFFSYRSRDPAREQECAGNDVIDEDIAFWLRTRWKHHQQVASGFRTVAPV